MLLELLNGGLTVANTHDPITFTLKIGCHRVADAFSSSTNKILRASEAMGGLLVSQTNVVLF